MVSQGELLRVTFISSYVKISKQYEKKDICMTITEQKLTAFQINKIDILCYRMYEYFAFLT